MRLLWLKTLAKAWHRWGILPYAPWGGLINGSPCVLRTVELYHALS